MKTYSKNSIKGKLDKLVGDYFRSRKCDNCGRTPACWAHTKSRRFISTRWLLINAFSLCASCHKWAHDQPDAFTSWIRENYPDRLGELQAAFNISRPIKDSELIELYEQLQQSLTTK